MKKAKEILCKFWKEEEGTTAVEYAVMLGLISAAIIATVTALGGTIDGVIQSVNDALPGGGV